MNTRLLPWLLAIALPLSGLSQPTDNILTTTTYRTGSYQTLDELRMNNPTLHPTLIVQAVGSKVKRYIARYADNNKRVKGEIYGFTRQDTLYVNANNYGNGHHFVPLQSLGVYCYLEDIITDSDAVAAGAVLGGLIGGALAGALASGNNSLVLSLRDGNYYVLNQKMMGKLLADDAELLRRYEQEPDPKQVLVVRECLDAYNERHQHELPDFATALEAKVIIYRRDKKERDEALLITAQDSSTVTLYPNEFQELRVPPRAMELCLGENCVTITPATQQTTYLRCSFVKKQSTAVLERVKPKVGSFYVREITYKQAKQ